MSQYDTERLLKELPSSDLRIAIRRPDPRISIHNAARVLLSRERLHPVEASKLILHSEVDPDSKLAAIHALGRTRERGAQELLMDQLGSQDLPELRTSIWSLAKIGDRVALDRLRQVDTDRRPALKPTLVAAQRLLAFRNGVPGFGFKDDELAHLAPMPTDRLRDMEIKLMEAGRLEQFERKIVSEAPGLLLRINGPATEINCLGKPLWLIPSEETVKTPEVMPEKPTVPMAIFSYDDCTEAPYLKAYVLSEPTSGGLNLYVTRLKGQVTHRGRAKVDQQSLSFELSALETRYDPAAELKGRVDEDGVLKVEMAKVSEQFEQLSERRLRPKEAIAPILSGSQREPRGDEQ